MIQFICFSKNRPLQLEGYLASFIRHVRGAAGASMAVIWRGDSPYREAYLTLIEQFPGVQFVEEDDFLADLTKTIIPTEFICFGCDDCLFIAPVQLDLVQKHFDADLLGFSLRLGRNVTRSMFSGPTPLPPSLTENAVLRWNLFESHAFGDWGYSWEVNGTIYPTDIARKLIEICRPGSPNILEATGGDKWSALTSRTSMASFTTSRLVVPTVNVVQRDFANPICGSQMLSTGLLLDCWNAGLRMDLEAFERTSHDCIHIADFHLKRI